MTTNELTPYRPEINTESLDARDPVPGEYWETSEKYTIERWSGDEYINPGEFVLITDVHTVEGDEIHSVTIYLPPRLIASRDDSDLDEIDITIGEFRQTFIPTKEDVVAQRQEDMAKALDEFKSISSDVSGRITHVVDKNKPEEVEQQDTPQQIASLSTSTERIQKEVDTITKTLAPRTEQLNKLVQAISGELVAQVKAALHNPKKLIKRLNKIITTLTTYSGEGVEIEQILTGTPAPADEPIHIYQAMRFMDEEYLIHIAEGGADYEDWEGFVTHLVENKEVLDRLIPSQRGMCVMRYRREEKIYYHGTSIEAYHANVEANVPNMIGFLLYRDGGNVWAIDSPVTAHEIPSLFPTQDQIMKPYQSSWSDEETTYKFEDIQYKRSFDESERKHYAYQKLVIVLWGLRDRAQLFPHLPIGDFGKQVHDPRLFRWVADDENLITDGKADLFEWLKENEKNYLMSGMRVFCNWQYLLKPHTNAKFGHLGKKHSVASGNEYDVLPAHKDGDDYYVKVPIRSRQAWRNNPDNYIETNTKVNITAHIKKKEWDYDRRRQSTAYMIMDAVRVEDISRFIYSRKAREHYLSYIDTFIAVRDYLRKDESEQSTMKEAVRKHVADDGFEDHWHTAVRLWRATRRGRQIPTTKKDPKFQDVLINLVASIKRARRGLEKPDWVSPDAFMVTQMGSGAFVTYRPESDTPDSCIPTHFVHRERWRTRKSKSPVRESSSLIKFNQTHPAKESLVWKTDDLTSYEYPTVDEYSEKNKWMSELTPNKRDRLNTLLRDTSSDSLLTGDVSSEFFNRHYKRWLNTVFIRPLASRYYSPVADSRDDHQLRILCFSMRPPQWFARYGTDEQQDQIEAHYKWVDNQYWAHWAGGLRLLSPKELLSDYKYQQYSTPQMRSLKGGYFPKHRVVSWEHNHWLDFMPDEVGLSEWRDERDEVDLRANPIYDQIYAPPELDVLHDMFKKKERKKV